MIDGSFDSARTALQNLLARADSGRLQPSAFERAYYAFRGEALVQRSESATRRSAGWSRPSA